MILKCVERLAQSLNTQCKVEALIRHRPSQEECSICILTLPIEAEKIMSNPAAGNSSAVVVCMWQ